MPGTQTILLNDGWLFLPYLPAPVQQAFEQDAEYLPEEPDFSSAQGVRLPHCAFEIPDGYADPKMAGGACAYQRTLQVPPDSLSGRLFLEIGGIYGSGMVYIGKRKAGSIPCGLFPSRLEVTGLLSPGENHLLVLSGGKGSIGLPFSKGFSEEFPSSGLFRGVRLVKEDGVFIQKKKSSLQRLGKGHYRMLLEEEAFTGGKKGLSFSHYVRPLSQAGVEGPALEFGETMLEEREDAKTGILYRKSQLEFKKVDEWEYRKPFLYELKTSVLQDGIVAAQDRKVFAFKALSFKYGRALFNGGKLSLHVLERHQVYPVAGYAVPGSLQEDDAKKAFYREGYEAVRVPGGAADEAFLSACDHLGLFVLPDLFSEPSLESPAEENSGSLYLLREFQKLAQEHPCMLLPEDQDPALWVKHRRMLEKCIQQEKLLCDYPCIGDKAGEDGICREGILGEYREEKPKAAGKGKAVFTRTLRIQADSRFLSEEGAYDMARIEVSLEGPDGQPLSMAYEPLFLEESGAVEITGARSILLKAGRAYFYVRSVKDGSRGLVIARTVRGESAFLVLDSQLSQESMEKGRAYFLQDARFYQKGD